MGRFLPAISHRLEPVPGIETGGRLYVSGPNIMLGYYRADNPGVLEPPPEREYDTGDIVEIDGDGYVTIAGRAKRFAKIAGEMVSLAAVEGYAAEVWPTYNHAVINIPDARKGEQLVLITDNPSAGRDDLLAFAQAQGIAEIMIPKLITPVETVPLLGTGKVDYAAVAEIAGELPGEINAVAHILGIAATGVLYGAHTSALQDGSFRGPLSARDGAFRLRSP